MELAQARDALRKSPSFAELDSSVVGALLLYAEEVELTAGKVLFEQGVDSGDRFCLLVEGELSVGGAGGLEIARLSPGALVGEIGIVSPQKKRTAGVRAATACAVLQWHFGALSEAVRQTLRPHLEKVAFERLATGLQ
jgi:CRP-like cAMP-binding protein